MNQDNTQTLIELLRKLANTHHIRPGEIPNIDLYMDQVIHFMDDHLACTRRSESDKLLTKTMINNYTKKKLLPPPLKKRYSGEHLHLLIFLYYFKDFLSLTDIRKILTPVQEHFSDIEEIYAELYKLNEDRIGHICQDILQVWQKASHSFSDMENEDASETASDADSLQLFSFLCMLGFDLYLKKQVIEQLVDALYPPAGSTD